LPEVSFEKKSGQNFDFNPVKCVPKVKRANITARANNTTLMVQPELHTRL